MAAVTECHRSRESGTHARNRSRPPQLEPRILLDKLMYPTLRSTGRHSHPARTLLPPSLLLALRASLPAVCVVAAVERRIVISSSSQLRAACLATRARVVAMEPSRRLLLSDYNGAIVSPLPSPSTSSATPFRPGVAVVVGILTSVFSITFLLLLYAKHCKRSAAESSGPYGSGGGSGGGAAGERRNSGVDRAVVESLPVFRFGALRGQKAGLECAVCLGLFEPTEALRLLPKCRHGFHVECVDTWLDAHSTCPLCRSRVDPEDVLLLPEPPKPSTTGPPEPPEQKAAAATATVKDKDVALAPAPAPSPAWRRISGRHSTGSVRAPGRVGPTSRWSADLEVGGGDGGAATVGCFDVAKVRKDRVLMVEPAAAVAEPDPEAFDRRFGHRILVSTACGCDDETAPAAKQRWSDLRPSDLMFVQSEMLVTETGRYSCSVAVNFGNRGRTEISGRSLSEIAGVSRLPPIRAGAEPRTEARRWPGSSWWARGSPGVNGPST